MNDKLQNKRVVSKTTSILFFAINILLILLLLLPNINNSMAIWWLDNLTNLQLQWSFFALILSVVNFWLSIKLRAIFILLFIGLVSYNFAPLYTTKQNQLNDNTAFIEVNNKQLSLRVAQLNLRYDNPNLQALLPRLGTEKFDVLVLQEVSDKQHHHINALKKLYSYAFGIDEQQSTPSGMAIFSRWPILETQRHRLGYKSGDILEILIQAPDQLTPVQLYALHPGSPRNKDLWTLRNQTFNAINELLKVSPFTYKIVVGDFNSSPWSGAFKKFQEEGHLKNTATGFGYMPTWSYSDTPLLSLLTSAYIDHNLVSFPINIINKQYQHIEGSDHRLIVTELGI